MKALTWIALIGSLAAAGSSAAAEDRSEIRPGAITRAMEREAVRLAALAGPASPVADSSERPPKPAPSDWSRVVRIERGREITFTSAGSQPGRGYLVKADELALTVVNLDAPLIPAEARGVLADAARSHPEYFDRAQGGLVLLGKELRLGPDGVFQRDQKLVELAEIVQSVPRGLVVEISVLAKHVGRHAKRGALAGAIVGGGLMGLACGLGCNGVVSTIGWIGVGAGAGAGYGALIGSIVGGVAPRTPDVIYRASQSSPLEP